MAHGDALSSVLLVIAIASTATGVLGALALGISELGRRRTRAGGRAESSTFRFRMPRFVDLDSGRSLDAESPIDLSDEPVALVADVTGPGAPADPTDRVVPVTLHEGPSRAGHEPFEDDDTVPFFDIEHPAAPVARAGA